jgi:hypothetical protein
MRKQKLLVCFMVLVLVSMGSFVLFGKKPVKYTWTATIPGESLNLYHPDSTYIYEDGKDGVSVDYETLLIDRKTNLENTKIMIGIDKTSLEAHVGFQGVQVYDLAVNNNGYAGGFPPDYSDVGDYPNDLSGCLYNFINTIPHPYTNDSNNAGYEHILFVISIGANLEDTSVFPIGVPVPDWQGHSANIYFWNNFETDDGMFIHYHTLTAHTELNIPFATSYEIKRIDGDSWKILIKPQTFTLEESYYEGSTSPIGNSGKVRTIREYHKPLIASADMSYAFILTRKK